MRSRLYVGHLWHERKSPVHNEFRYPIYCLGLDLDEIDALDAKLRVFSYNRPGLVSFWDRDHGPLDGSPLKPWITEVVSRVGIDLTGGRVVLLTLPRVFGTGFYPVSFWYCFGADSTPLAVLAEVQNTHRDHHNYLLHNNGAPFDWNSKPTATKVFYVSPFIQIEDVEYDFHFSQPGDDLSVVIRDTVEGTHIFTAAIKVRAHELTDSALIRTVASHGPVSGVALIRIHWQALKLIAKKVPFHQRVPAPSKRTSL